MAYTTEAKQFIYSQFTPGVNEGRTTLKPNSILNLNPFPYTSEQVEPSLVEASISRVLPSTVTFHKTVLTNALEGGTKPIGEGIGAGSVIHSDPKQLVILTAAHVTDQDAFTGPTEVEFCELGPDGLPDPAKSRRLLIQPEDIHRVEGQDMALVIINNPGIVVPAVKIADTDMSTGQVMYTVGAPNGIPNTVREGQVVYPEIVMVRGFQGQGQELVEIHAGVEPGNSGGGAFNPHTDELIGMPVMLIADSEEGPWREMMIPASTIRRAIADQFPELAEKLGIFSDRDSFFLPLPQTRRMPDFV